MKITHLTPKVANYRLTSFVFFVPDGS